MHMLVDVQAALQPAALLAANRKCLSSSDLTTIRHIEAAVTARQAHTRWDARLELTLTPKSSGADGLWACCRIVLRDRSRAADHARLRLRGCASDIFLSHAPPPMPFC